MSRLSPRGIAAIGMLSFGLLGVAATPLTSPAPLRTPMPRAMTPQTGPLTAADAALYQRYRAFDPAALAGVPAAALPMQLAAIRRRPTDPTSRWAERLASPAPGGRFLGLAAPTATGVALDSVDAAEAPVRVWYMRARPADGTTAARLAAEVDRTGMWAKEQAAMLGHTPCSDADLPENGDDGRLDIYLLPPGRTIGRPDSGGDRSSIPDDDSDFETYGVTIPQGDSENCAEIDFILLNNGVGFDSLRSTLAHELFHAFQGSFPQDGDKDAWWAEATATWAEDYIYPDLNEEQSQLEDGGWARNPAALGPLDRWEDDGVAQYGAYIWPFYLTHRSGGRPALIGQIYSALKDETALDVMHGWRDWPARFKEFALWNWNKDPVDMYRDNGEHIDPLVQSIRYLGDHGKMVLDSGPQSSRVQLKYASMVYYELRTVDDGSDTSEFVHQLHVDVSDITRQPGAGVQAIVTLGTGPYPFFRYVNDWSWIGSKTFCRDRRDEQVSNLVLVVTNANVDAGNLIRGRITTRVSGDACPTER